MEILIGCCAGLDVHKDSVEVCVRKLEPEGKLSQQTRHWGTMTRDLVAMAEWLRAEGVTHVAMESTGVYWKPIFNVLESEFEVLLVNARTIKHVPGRKTDVQDCQWIAQLLQHGLLKGSFIPPRWQRELRDLTRQRAQVIGEHSRTTNRIQKVLEDANLKLGSVASDVVGVSGRHRLEAMIAGTSDPKQLANLAQRRLRSKIPQLEEALYGKLTEHHRWMLHLLWDQLLATEQFIARLDERIAQLTRLQQPVLEKLDAIPGIDRRVAEVGAGGGNRAGYDAVSQPCAPGLLGGLVSGQQRECRQEAKRQDDQGKPLVAPSAGASGLGGEPQERQLFPGPCPEPDAPSRS